MKGKNFSANRKVKDRNKNDLYQTSKPLTRLLLSNFDKIKSTDTILEPCYGRGAIFDVLKEYFDSNQLYASDIYDYDLAEYDYELDFLLEENYWQKNNFHIDWIITNVPFKHANAFVYKCKQVAKKGFILLFPTSYLQSQTRYNTIFNLKDNYRLKKLWTYSRYPLLEL